MVKFVSLPPEEQAEEPRDSDKQSAMRTAEQLLMSEFRRSDFFRFLVECACESQPRCNSSRTRSAVLTEHGWTSSQTHVPEEPLKVSGTFDIEKPFAPTNPRTAFAPRANGVGALRQKSSTDSIDSIAELQLVTCQSCLRPSRAELAMCPHCGKSLDGAVLYQASAAPLSLRLSASGDHEEVEELPGSMPAPVEQSKTEPSTSGCKMQATVRPPIIAFTAERKHVAINGKKSLESSASFQSNSPKTGNKSNYFQRMTTKMISAARSTRKSNAVFLDAEVMKEKVRVAVAKPEYSVHDYYRQDGVCQAIARHPYFELFTLAVIAINAVWIAIETDNNKAALTSEADAVWQIADHFFCVFFLTEWTIRFVSFEHKKDGLNDFWFVFDGCLVVLMVIDTWIISVIVSISNLRTGAINNTSALKVLRLARLTRMARMARLIEACPELTILVKGITVAARSVFFTLCLLLIIVYVFAIGLTQLTAGTDIGRRYFNSVPEAMSSLLLEATLPDLSDFVRTIGAAHALYVLVILIFVLLATLTVMNMLVGVVIEVVNVVSAVEKEQLKVTFVKEKLQEMMTVTGFDEDGDMMISRSEFTSLLMNDDAVKIILDIGVDPVALVDFTDYIFGDEYGSDADVLSFEKFIEVVMQFRGNNTTTLRDIMDLRKILQKDLSRISGMISKQNFLISELQSQVKRILV